MPTKKPRLNVVLEHKVYEILTNIAKKKGISLSLLARDLIKDALEIYEDIYWDEIAGKREKTFSYERALSHKETWE